MLSERAIYAGMKLHPAAAAACVSIGLVSVVIARGGDLSRASHGTLDFLMFCGFVVLLWWLLSDFGTGKDARAHEEPDKSVLFRLGKALNRVLRGRRRHTATRD